MSDCHIICSWDMRYHVQRGNEEGWDAAGDLAMAALFGGAGAKAVKYGFSSFGEARRLYNEWGVGTFDTVGQNIRHHTNERGSQKKTLDDGSIRYNRPNGEFLIQRDGLTVTYGWNK